MRTGHGEGIFEFLGPANPDPRYPGFPGRNALRKELVELGELIPIEVEGVSGTRYVVRDDVELLQAPPELPPSVAFLSPYDAFVWDRKLLGSLFDFEYVWELYVPPHKRRWGWYVLPIVFRDRLVGRIEPRIDPAESTVQVLALWWEHRLRTTPDRRVRRGDARSAPRLSPLRQGRPHRLAVRTSHRKAAVRYNSTHGPRVALRRHAGPRAAQLARRGRARAGRPSAAFPIPALTAAQVLDEALGIERGGWVVVNGAGGVTGGLLVQLAAARGARVIATTSAKKAERIRDYGASEVLDYHDDWPAFVRELTGGGAPKAVNAARGQAATTLQAVADGSRLATITGDPPPEERGIAVSDIYVRPDGRQLSALAELLANGTLSVPIASVGPLEQAAQALREVVAGADGAIVLSLRT